MEESAWVESARRGDFAAMERLYEAHRSMVFAVGLSVCGNGSDADEVLQETFLRAFRSLSDWRGQAQFSTWLYSIALRTALNWRSRFVKRPRPASAEEFSVPEDRLVRREELDRLSQAIEDLPVQQRLVLTLKHLKGLSLAEIAHLQGCAVGTVKSNLHHAMTKLKDVLAGSFAP